MAHTYYRTIKANAKGRWLGKTLADVAKELKPTSINGPEIVGPRDVIEYTLHVHEPEVHDRNIKLLAETNEYIAVCKPHGLPTHPTVNYYKNSATYVLENEGPIGHKPLKQVYPCYRLDRLTGGLLVVAKTPEAASRFHLGQKDKVYYARVRGRVSAESCTAPLALFNTKRGFPAFQKALQSAKPCHTKFVEEAVFNDGTSLVKCLPITGKTHQIRRHLALLGAPIANDRLYNDGLFKTLIESPTQENFEVYHNVYLERKKELQSGEQCQECGTDLFLEPKKEQQMIWLHCFRIELGDSLFEAPLPEWAMNLNLHSTNPPQQGAFDAPRAND